MAKPLQSLNKKSNIVTLSRYKDLHKIPLRGNGSHCHGNQTYDFHLWLNPLNAQYIAHIVAEELIKRDPDNKIIYEKNEEEFKSKLYNLDTELRDVLRKVKGRNIIVFHEAYLYFASHYDLHIVTFPMRHSVFVGAKSLQNIRDKIIMNKTSCIFYDPEFDPKIIHSLTEGTNVASAMLDPEGTLLEESPDLYFQLMKNISNSIATNCIV
nr:zinc ABC transporter substrate-binding protein [Candidatus Liberibacter africanus]